MKRTKIVATISDKRCDVDFLQDLYAAGMDVVRLNTAHQTLDDAMKVIRNVRIVSDKIPLLIDTKGPEIRTKLIEQPMEVEKGEVIYITGDDTLTLDEKLTWGLPFSSPLPLLVVMMITPLAPREP